MFPSSLTSTLAAVFGELWALSRNAFQEWVIPLWRRSKLLPTKRAGKLLTSKEFKKACFNHTVGFIVNVYFTHLILQTTFSHASVFGKFSEIGLDQQKCREFYSLVWNAPSCLPISTLVKESQRFLTSSFWPNSLASIALFSKQSCFLFYPHQSIRPRAFFSDDVNLPSLAIETRPAKIATQRWLSAFPAISQGDEHTQLLAHFLTAI